VAGREVMADGIEVDLDGHAIAEAGVCDAENAVDHGLHLPVS
jgi:hypothetical protein